MLDWLKPRKQSRSDNNARSVGDGLAASKAETLLSAAHQSLARGAYQPAVAAYQAFLRINPRHAVALNCLGAALGSLGHYRDAETYFERAIDIDPNYPEAYCNLGAALRARAQLENAQVALRQALRLDLKPYDWRPAGEGQRIKAVGDDQPRFG